MKPETCLLEYVLSSSLTNVDLNISEPSVHHRVSLCGSNHVSVDVKTVFGLIYFQYLCHTNPFCLEFNQSRILYELAALIQDHYFHYFPGCTVQSAVRGNR